MLSREDVQALLAALLFEENVPFVRSDRPYLSNAERSNAEAAERKLSSARARQSDESSCQLSADESAIVARVAVACLQEMTDDVDISCQVGGTRLAHLRAALATLQDGQ